MTQQQTLLKYLQEGTVNSYTATYVYGIKQAPTRIKELKELGYNIQSFKQPNRSVDWVLASNPRVKQTQEPIAKHYCFYTGTPVMKNIAEERCICTGYFEPVQEGLGL